MIMGGRVWIFGAHDVIDFFDFSETDDVLLKHKFWGELFCGNCALLDSW